MQYTTLGNTGLVVSRLSFGAMTFTAGNKSFAAVYKTEAEAANAMIGKALDAGINFFDTADAYAGGESETMLGRALKSRRAEVVITTKVGNRTGPGLVQSGLSRRHILWSIDQSLKRLDTDFVDCYIAHKEDPHTPLEATERSEGCERGGAWRSSSDEVLWQRLTRSFVRARRGILALAIGRRGVSLRPWNFKRPMGGRLSRMDRCIIVY
jgi:aryl-alcohol dehydrogenase-like predicted oxidoreductase